MKVLIAGASGLVGTSLVKSFERQGDEVVKFVRDQKYADDAFENFDAVINLAGENIFGRWTESKKKKILESRVETTKRLCQILARLKHPPKVLVNASAIGFYGDRGDELLTEESSPGNNFLADVCQKWEAATRVLKTRVVFLRTGVVLAKEGGALKTMLPAFKLGLGGNLGSGTQYMSFITLHDLVKVIQFVIENESISGPVNAVTPNPITNEKFTKELGAVLHRPTFFSVPAFAARLIFGQMADELLLASTRVIPQKLLSAGFHFDFPTVADTLNHCLKGNQGVPPCA